MDLIRPGRRAGWVAFLAMSWVSSWWNPSRDKKRTYIPPSIISRQPGNQPVTVNQTTLRVHSLSNSFTNHTITLRVHSLSSSFTHHTIISLFIATSPPQFCQFPHFSSSERTISPQYQSTPSPHAHSQSRQGGGKRRKKNKDKLGLTRVRAGLCDTKNRVVEYYYCLATRVSAIQTHYTICPIISSSITGFI